MGWKCEDLKSRWLDYLDGLLPPLERKRFEEHLGGCSGCREAAAEHRETWSLLGHTVEVDPSPFFVACTMRELRSAQALSRAMKVRRAVVAAAASLFIALSLIFYFSRVPPALPDSVVEAGLLENMELLEDLDFLMEHGEELELAMEYDLYDMMNDGERLQ
jgi:anti-sigma factor RsiW